VGKQAKPKVNKGSSSDRQNGKAPKQNPKSNVSKNKSSGGYSPAALARRAARREQLTLGGLWQGRRRPVEPLDPSGGVTGLD